MSTSTKNVKTGYTNYARLGIASQELLPEMMQRLLLELIPNKQIAAECRKLKNQKVMNAMEWMNVNQAHTAGYSNFDIPLIYKLLRNLELVRAPTKGWDYPRVPDANDITIGDDLERIRLMRNNLSHRSDASVTDQEFTNHFVLLRDIAERFERILNITNKEFVSKVIDLQMRNMDEETEAIYVQRLKDLAINESEIKQRVTQLEEDMIGIKTKLSDEDNVQFITTLEDVICFEGDCVSLQCQIADGKPVAKWYKNEERVLSDNLVDESKDQRYKLTIRNATKDDSDNYTVQIGNKNSKARLIVKERVPSLIKLRDYQKELAAIALKKANTIICAGTNAGKTYVALYVIEDHLLRNPNGKVAFMTTTNVLQDQQYRTASDKLIPPSFKGKIIKWDATSQNDKSKELTDVVKNAQLLFLTPKSLCNYLTDGGSIQDFSMLVFDECHHTFQDHPYNEVMSYYRQQKFGVEQVKVPQILGLTASPGTNKAKTEGAAVDHLKKIMSNLDVSKLSVVKQNEKELLQFSSLPIEEWIKSVPRRSDPVKTILTEAMIYVEKIFDREIVADFLLDNTKETNIIGNALDKTPSDKSGQQYIQWIAETKKRARESLHQNPTVSSLILICLKHLKLYVSCLEVNELLEINDVINILKDGYGQISRGPQFFATKEESDIDQRLKEVHRNIRELRGTTEKNPDIEEIIKIIETEYSKYKENSRFFVFVKTRNTAMLLTEKLPPYLKCTYLTGSQVNKEKGGLHKREQLEITDNFKNGRHLCIVATSIASEGLDIPECNLMIRYKFTTNEIASLQMRGRVRAEEGRKVILAPLEDFKKEDENIQRQYLMKTAIEKVIKLDLSEYVISEQTSTYLKEKQDKEDTRLKFSQKKKGRFTVNCGGCNRIITDGEFLRSIHKTHYIIIDKTVLSKITRKKTQVKSFDGITKLSKVYGSECDDNWGCILRYREHEFVSLSQDYIVFFDQVENKTLNFRKWTQLPFAIDDVTDDEIASYGQS